jgi:uncharacterized zinc-type alcohol dehydrogenase-like protein
MVGTYASRYKHPHCPGYNEADPSQSEPTYGGYSQDIVVDHNYVCSVPEHLEMSQVAPLLCAGVTVWSPMKYYGLQKGDKFAVAGLGGLGSMAVKFAVAMGCHVTVLSRGTAKKEDAMSNLKAHAYLDTTDPEAVKAHRDTFNFMINTISAKHDINMYMNMLDYNGKCVMVGAQADPLPLHSFSYITKRKQLVGSLIGGIRETQEMLDFCGEHGITCSSECIKPEQINEAYERTINSDVKYRFSIDVTQM